VNKPNCYRRLKIFSEDAKNVFKVDRVISIDIDAVIVGNIDHILAREEEVIGWRNVSGVPFQGSLTSHKLGTRAYIWDDFIKNPVIAREQAKKYVGSDQAWVSHKLSPHEAIFTPAKDGVYSYKKSIIPFSGGFKLPPNASIVFFHGFPKPEDLINNHNYKWIKDNYK